MLPVGQQALICPAKVVAGLPLSTVKVPPLRFCTTPRVLRLDEAGDSGQHAFVAAEVASARDREVESGAGARSVTDVIEQKAHQTSILRVWTLIRNLMH